MTPAGLPSWPTAPVAYGPVVLRQFSDRDVPMAQELATDPYVPLVGSLPANASREQARWPGVGVLVLSQHVHASYAVELLSAGAEGVGYLLKERISDLAELASSVRRVGAGGSVLDPAVVSQLVGKRRREADPLAPLGQLSTREREVLTLMAEGRSNKAIAERLFVSEYTVQKHVGNIFDTLRLPPSPDDHRRVLAVVAYLNAQ